MTNVLRIPSHFSENSPLMTWFYLIATKKLWQLIFLNAESTWTSSYCGSWWWLWCWYLTGWYTGHIKGGLRFSLTFMSFISSKRDADICIVLCRYYRIFKLPLKAHWQIPEKWCLLKVFFMWYSMPIFSFLEYTLMESFRKPGKRQICKQTRKTFYTSNDVSL